MTSTPSRLSSASPPPAVNYAMTGRTSKRVRERDADEPVPFLSTDDAIRFRLAVVPDCDKARNALGSVP
jgi:hypothetical protein